MSFDWNMYLKLAGQLADGSGESGMQEAKLRAAISRAYYSAYHVARVFLQDVRHDRTHPDLGSAHAHVRTLFLDAGGDINRRIATYLSTLHADRKHADYDDEFRGRIASKASFCLENAKTIISLVDELRESESP